jgi:hypothetical protein
MMWKNFVVESEQTLSLLTSSNVIKESFSLLRDDEFIPSIVLEVSAHL